MSTPDKTLVTLEYDKVIARLARNCQTEPGRELALSLRPSPEYAEVLHRQRLTAEARRLLELKPNVSVSAARDMRTIVHQAALGRTLDPAELLEVQATLSMASSLREIVERLRSYMPFLADIASRIGDFREVTADIGRCINQHAEIVDAASPALAQLRREARIAHDRLSARLQQIVKSGRSAIQEPIITLRDGRYVIPVKAEQRSQLPGIVHDVSSSGATVFLEPLETVEMGNHWRELLAEEQREIARILRALSQLVGARDVEVSEAVEAVAQIDLLTAKVRLGESMGATDLPHDDHNQRWLLEEPGELLLLNARHPLLKGDVVPITVWMGYGDDLPRPAGASTDGGFSVLLITGPNTGGKTVALKTVGLLSLMAQAGLPVPAAPDSRMPVFDAAFADIGDEQSIEQSLSTFSSHVGNIISILKSATPRSLVLLDELAAGTDPVEGSALAKAMLSYLLQVGCLTFATTHHGELKAYAHVTAGISNASVEFDPDTLSPTYRLHIGVPGQSNALAIAQRLGMPEEVLDEARSGIDPDRLAVESLITDLHRHREEAETASEAQRAAVREAELARERVTKELRSLEANRERLIERTRREMETELQQARARIRKALKEIERAERLTVFERAAVGEKVEEDLAGVAETARKVERKRRRPRRGPLPPIESGDRIFLRDVPTPGRALGAPDEMGDLDVTLGSLRARINVKQIEEVQKAAEAERELPERRPDSERVLPVAVPPELDLRGLTVDEALMLIDQRIDEASRAGVPQLRIIHGKGTGTLRRAIREMLRKHALVRSQAPAERREGGDGVTVVELAH
jgi:DNA mismatch repair protein MutS2